MGVNWAAIYRTRYQDLVRFLYRKVWDQERAEDLAQETFARVLSHAPENPAAWIFTVAANLARDEARLAIRRRRHLRLLEQDAQLGTRFSPDPDEQLERAEQRCAVKAALATLSERDREVLLLWDAGQSYDEIAEQTGLARGAVGTTLTRARKRLIEAYRNVEAVRCGT